MPPRDQSVITGSRRPGFPLAATSGVAARGFEPPHGTPKRKVLGRPHIAIAATCNADRGRLLHTAAMSLRCLIVDDNPRFLEAASASLEREGIDVAGTATTGDQALSRATALEPDVALVDITLGEESGFELARRLAGALPDLRILLISTRAAEDYADMIATSPAIGFVSKSHLSAAVLRGLLHAGGPVVAGAEPAGPSGPPGR